jgi:hypothetical protein
MKEAIDIINLTNISLMETFPLSREPADLPYSHIKEKSSSEFLFKPIRKKTKI